MEKQTQVKVMLCRFITFPFKSKMINIFHFPWYNYYTATICFLEITLKYYLVIDGCDCLKLLLDLYRKQENLHWHGLC